MKREEIIATIIIGIVLAIVFSSLPNSKIDWLKQIHPNFNVGEK